MKKQNSKRPFIQLASTLFHNPYLGNFVKGKIYQGPSKNICVPGLNCYSCPAAQLSCPIGSLQAVLGGRGSYFSFYVTGLILLFGILLGRLICGFLCPFGFIQDLLYKVPLKKKAIPQKADRLLRFGKYVTLIMVVLFPILLTDPYGIGTPYFCKWICPAGTLEGGIPLAIANPAIRASLGLLFNWKVAVLVLILLTSMVIYRPFCKYLCPLGAIYGLLNRFSFYQMHVDTHMCISCGKCEKSCPMQVKIRQAPNSPECIRCGVCKSACPAKAIHTCFVSKQREME